MMAARGGRRVRNDEDEKNDLADRAALARDGAAPGGECGDHHRRAARHSGGVGASDLLFLSVGLWLMRGVILVRRVREHTLLAG